MGHEFVFAIIALVVTCLLLRLREWVIGEPASNVTLASFISQEAGVGNLADDWPSEIAVPPDFFQQPSL